MPNFNLEFDPDIDNILANADINIDANIEIDHNIENKVPNAEVLSYIQNQRASTLLKLKYINSFTFSAEVEYLDY